MRQRGDLALFVLILAILSVFFIFNPQYTGYTSIFFSPENLTVESNSAVILWTTDVESNSTIIYGDAELNLSESREDFE
ncbi:hypothetical protein KY308_02095, partial [Candidatus Woesearchaeota archaeon]|nr:hypothetical protein [Candidatus Woesearchaeota archaeon]